MQYRRVRESAFSRGALFHAWSLLPQSQPHLLTLFDAVARLHFDEDAGLRDALVAAGSSGVATDGSAPTGAGFAPPISAMLSPEGEVLHLVRSIKPRGQAEDWLTQVESGMKASLRKAVRERVWRRRKGLSLYVFPCAVCRCAMLLASSRRRSRVRRSCHGLCARLLRCKQKRPPPPPPPQLPWGQHLPNAEPRLPLFVRLR